MMAKTCYLIWRDLVHDCYDILYWDGSHETVVQTNIRTREKARMALSLWRQREKEAHAER